MSLICFFILFPFLSTLVVFCPAVLASSRRRSRCVPSSLPGGSRLHSATCTYKRRRESRGPLRRVRPNRRIGRTGWRAALRLVICLQATSTALRGQLSRPKAALSARFFDYVLVNNTSNFIYSAHTVQRFGKNNAFSFE